MIENKDLNTALEVMTNALTDEMVERTASNFEKILELVDRLNEPQMTETIDKLAKNAEIISKSMENLIGVIAGISTLLNAFTDSMVEKLSSSANEMGELLDEVNRANVKDLLPYVSNLNAGNNLEALVDLINAVSVMRNAFTDSMVERIVTLITDITVNLARFRVEEIGTATLSSIEQASKAAEELPEKPGISGLLKAIRDPEVQRGLIFALYLIRDLSKALTRQ